MSSMGMDMAALPCEYGDVEVGVAGQSPLDADESELVRLRRGAAGNDGQREAAWRTVGSEVRRIGVGGSARGRFALDFLMGRYCMLSGAVVPSGDAGSSGTERSRSSSRQWSWTWTSSSRLSVSVGGSLRPRVPCDDWEEVDALRGCRIILRG